MHLLKTAPPVCYTNYLLFCRMNPCVACSAHCKGIWYVTVITLCISCQTLQSKARKKSAQQNSRKWLIFIGVDLWTRRSAVHEIRRVESEMRWKHRFLWSYPAVRVHEQKRKTPRRLGLSGVDRKWESVSHKLHLVVDCGHRFNAALGSPNCCSATPLI